ncbi:MAG TPA: DUF1844 domain-containing protein [Acidobacteriota bacterium]|nr:DUF1844 domain-containing protein [Acidobacteriota bacterium]
MPETDALLIQLIVSFQSAAMLQMGKIMNPVTGKVERDLDSAQQTIDLLAMLQRKTAGNLTDDERRYLDHVLYELRLNYVDETERPPETEAAKDKEEPTAPASDQPPDAAGSDAPSETDDEEKPA